LFLVFEIEAETLTAARGRDPKQKRNGFAAEPLGAYLAKNGTEACELAAQQHGSSGVFAVVAPAARTIEFRAEKFSKRAEKDLAKKPQGK
jgi:hypothetical protein